PVLHFDGIHRTPAEGNLYLIRVLAVRFQLEELDCAVLLSEDWPTDIYDVVQFLQLYGAVHAQIGTQDRGELAAQRDVYSDRAVENRRMNSRYLPIAQPVPPVARQARIDFRRLADGDVADLGFGDLQLRLEVRGLRDFAECRTGGYFLSFFHLGQWRRQ